MTYEEFLHRYDGCHAEWVEGEVIEMSPTCWENRQLADFLTALWRRPPLMDVLKAWGLV